MEDNRAVAANKKHTLLAQCIYCLPCIVYSAVVILIVRAHLCKNLSFGGFWSFDSEYLLDLSAWWKSRIVVISTIFAFGILLWRIFNKSLKIKKTILYIPMAVYAVTVILSFVFSAYKETAWSGANDRYEGTYILRKQRAQYHTTFFTSSASFPALPNCLLNTPFCLPAPL